MDIEEVVKEIIAELMKDGLQYDIYQDEEGTLVDVDYKRLEKMLKKRDREGVLAWYVMKDMDVESLVLEIVR